MHVQYLSVEIEKINNHYFIVVGPGNAFSILKIFWGSMTPLEQLQNFFEARNFWGQPATLPDKIVDQRLY